MRTRAGIIQVCLAAALAAPVGAADVELATGEKFETAEVTFEKGVFTVVDKAGRTRTYAADEVRSVRFSSGASEAPLEAATEAKARAWVQALGDRRYETREEAQAKLLELAESHPKQILALLPETDEDPELMARVKEIRSAIQIRQVQATGILPGGMPAGDAGQIFLQMLLAARAQQQAVPPPAALPDPVPEDEPADEDGDGVKDAAAPEKR